MIRLKKVIHATTIILTLIAVAFAAPTAAQVTVNTEMYTPLPPLPDTDLESTVINIIEWGLLLIIIISFLLLMLGIIMTVVRSKALKHMREQHAQQYGPQAPWSEQDQQQYHKLKRSRIIYIVLLCLGGVGILLSLIAWVVVLFVVSSTAMIY